MLIKMRADILISLHWSSLLALLPSKWPISLSLCVFVVVVFIVVVFIVDDSLRQFCAEVKRWPATYLSLSSDICVAFERLRSVRNSSEEGERERDNLEGGERAKREREREVVYNCKLRQIRSPLNSGPPLESVCATHFPKGKLQVSRFNI